MLGPGRDCLGLCIKYDRGCFCAAIGLVVGLWQFSSLVSLKDTKSHKNCDSNAKLNGFVNSKIRNVSGSHPVIAKLFSQILQYGPYTGYTSLSKC